MKILQVASSLFDKGGIEKSVVSLSIGLRERGHDVAIAAPAGSWIQEQAQIENIEILPMAVRSQYDLSRVVPFSRLFSQRRYDVVNTHFSPDYIIPALAAQISGQPHLVMTRYHVKPWRGTKRWLYEKGLGYSKIIAVSHAVRNALLEGGIAGEFVEVVHGGVPSQLQPSLALRAELGLSSHCILVGIVSRISPEKGHRLLLEAMRHVDQNVVCLVVGDGPDLLKMQQFVKESGIEERVRFLGWRTDSGAVIAALDIVVQPSLWEEACSLAIMEAMASGKALVVTQSGGNQELVLHERTGLVVSKSDTGQLVEAINLLARDTDLRDRYGAAAHLRQQELFTVQAMAEGTERVYQQLLSQ